MEGLPALAAVTRRNLRETLCTRSQLKAVKPVIESLAGHVGQPMAEMLLQGCFVRVKKGGQYVLRRIVATRLPCKPAADLLIEVEVINSFPPPDKVKTSAAHVSGVEPFTDDAPYNSTGRAELQAFQGELAAAGMPRGYSYVETAAALWRRTVALGWAAHLQEWLETRGISVLQKDLQDTAKILENARRFVDALPPHHPAAAAVAAAPPPAHPEVLPAATLPPVPSAATSGPPSAAPAAALQATLSAAQPARTPSAAQVAGSAAAALHSGPTAAVAPAVATEALPAAAVPAVPTAAVSVQLAAPPPSTASPFASSVHRTEPLQAGQPQQQQRRSPTDQQQGQELPASLPPQQAVQQQQPQQQRSLQPLSSMEQQKQEQQQKQRQRQQVWAPKLPRQQAQQPSQQQQQPLQQQPLLQQQPWQQQQQPSQAKEAQHLGPTSGRSVSLPAQHSEPSLALQHSGPSLPAQHPGPSLPAQHSGPSLPAQHMGASRPVQLSGGPSLPAQFSGLSWLPEGSSSRPRPAGQGPQLFALEVSGLPSNTTDGQLAMFCRTRYPSFIMARVLGPHHGAVHFCSREERDEAFLQMPRTTFDGFQLSARMPSGEAPPVWPSLFVSGIAPHATEHELLHFFRQQYPSVRQARLMHMAEDTTSKLQNLTGNRPKQRAMVRFGDAAERDAALVEMHGAQLKGFTVNVQLPREEQTASAAGQAVGRPRAGGWGGDPPHLGSTMAGAVQVLAQQPQQQQPGGQQQQQPQEQQLGQQPQQQQLPQQQTQQPQQQQPQQPQQQHWQQQSPPTGAEAEDAGFPLLVLNLGLCMTPEELLAYFRVRYPSVLSASLRAGFGLVRFASDAERCRAKAEMEGHVLPGGRKIGTGFPQGSTPAPGAGGGGMHGTAAAQLPSQQFLQPPHLQLQQQPHLQPQPQPWQQQEDGAAALSPQASARELQQQLLGVLLQQETSNTLPLGSGATPHASEGTAPAAAHPSLPPGFGFPVASPAAAAARGAAVAPAVAAPCAAPEHGQQQRQLLAFESGLSSTGMYVPGEAATAAAATAVGAVGEVPAVAAAPADLTDVDPTVGSTGQLVSCGSGHGSGVEQNVEQKASREQQQEAARKAGSSGKKRGRSRSPEVRPSSRRVTRSPNRRDSSRRSRSATRRRDSSKRSRSPPRRQPSSKRSPIRRPSSRRHSRSPGRRQRELSRNRERRSQRRSSSRERGRHGRTPSPPRRQTAASRRSVSRERRRQGSRSPRPSRPVQLSGGASKKAAAQPGSVQAVGAPAGEAPRGVRRRSRTPDAAAVQDAAPARGALRDSTVRERSRTPDAAQLLGLMQQQAAAPVHDGTAHALAQQAVQRSCPPVFKLGRGRSPTPDADDWPGSFIIYPS